MKDQADKLREIIESLKKKQMKSNDSSIIYENSREKATKSRIITITSGKGGVGKTNIAVNLSIALGTIGYRVALIDADLGLANIDVMLGISSKYSLVDILNDEIDIMETLSEGPRGIKFISGGSGIEELVKLDKEQLEKFINNIGILDNYFDIIIIDTGAGLSDNVLSFVMSSDEVIIVTTPDPTAITDAYALIKIVSSRDMHKNVKIIVNRAETIREANDVLDKLVFVSDKFLKMKVLPLGIVLYDENVVKAVKMQQPFFISNPNSIASKLIKDISMNLSNKNNYTKNLEESGMRSFVKKLYSFFAG
mgnify:CR=1 FL=1